MSFSDFIVAGEWNNRPAKYRRDQILVKVLDNVAPANIQSVVEHALALVLPGAQVSRVAARLRLAVVTIPNMFEAGQVAAQLAGFGIEFAEPDFLLTGNALALTDTLLGSQDWLDTINMQEAWELMLSSTWGFGIGDTDVLLAVFDSGIQMYDGVEVDHPDFDKSRFIVTHDIGAGPVSHDYWMGEEFPADKNGHGTQVTGILAATGNNSKGIAGANWESYVYVARVLDDKKDTVASAVLFAMNDLMDYADHEEYDRIVVNLSLGSTDSEEVGTLDTMISNLDADPRRYLLCCAMKSVKDSVTGKYYADYPSRYAATKTYVVSVAESDNATPEQVRYPLSSMVPATSTEITVVAPGLDAFTTILHDPSDTNPLAFYDIGTGTSMAAPMVSGIASLMWTVAPWLTPEQIKQALIDTAIKIVRDGIDYFRVDARNAIANVRAEIALKTPTLSFIDIVEGSESTESVVMSVTGLYDLTFKVVPESLVGLDPAFSVLSESMTWVHGTGDVTGIIIKYTAGIAGSTATGSIRIQVDGSDFEWTVALNGNSVALPAIALAIVADTSGSMALASGIGTKTRMTVLQESLATVIDTLTVGGACALIRFDTDAHLEMALQNIALVGPGDAGRTNLQTAVDALTPGGETSIGDGAKLGDETAVADGTRKPAVLVLTDGHENKPEYINVVKDEITSYVYAIGMGTEAIINSDTLESFANERMGYLLLTDALDDSNQNRVKKFCLQILADATGGTVMVDPQGYLQPGADVEIPFWLTRHDTHCDAFLLLPEHDAITMKLETPSGTVIAPESALPGVSYVAGSFVSYYRLNFGAALGRQRDGKWLARLSVSRTQLGKYSRKARRSRPALGPRIAAHGIPYDFMVTGHSSIVLRAKSYANGTVPGSRVVVRAVIDGVALIDSKLTSVTAETRAPDGTCATVRMRDLGRGVYQGEFTAEMRGVHTTRVFARGFTPLGQHFTREQVVTAGIWIPPRANLSAVARGEKKPNH